MCSYDSVKFLSDEIIKKCQECVTIVAVFQKEMGHDQIFIVGSDSKR